MYGVQCWHAVKRYMPKLINTAKLKDWFDDDMEWFATRVHWYQCNCVILHRHRSCRWRTFWTLRLNTDFHHWNVWTAGKKLCKVRFVIRKHSTCNCFFTWKIELQSQNCCIYWTISVVSIKFAAYVIWILTYTASKFGPKLCYYCWNTENLWGYCYLLVHPVDQLLAPTCPVVNQLPTSGVQEALLWQRDRMTCLSV